MSKQKKIEKLQRQLHELQKIESPADYYKYLGKFFKRMHKVERCSVETPCVDITLPGEKFKRFKPGTDITITVRATMKPGKAK